MVTAEMFPNVSGRIHRKLSEKRSAQKAFLRIASQSDSKPAASLASDMQLHIRSIMREFGSGTVSINIFSVSEREEEFTPEMRDRLIDFRMRAPEVDEPVEFIGAHTYHEQRREAKIRNRRTRSADLR